MPKLTSAMVVIAKKMVITIIAYLESLKPT